MTGVWLRRVAPKDRRPERIAPGKAGNADAVDPGAGAGGLVIVAKLRAGLHTPPAEEVLAFVMVSGGLRAPPEVARRDLEDESLAGRSQHRNDSGLVRLPLHVQHPAHDVDALGVPARFDAEPR